MNIDANVQKIVMLLLRKWRIIIIFALIGTFLAYFYTANFTVHTYTSQVEFLAYAVDSKQEFSDSSGNSVLQQQASNTSKMNYAMKMMNTYIEMFQTNSFNQTVANDINENLGTNYSASEIADALTFETVSDTSLFKVTATTTDATKSYQIAHQLETTIPKVMKVKNNGLVSVSIEDHAVQASEYESLGYVKKCVAGFILGAILSAAFVLLRDLIDIRIRTSEELTERYDIPVLGAIPEFELKAASRSAREKSRGESTAAKEDNNG
jgi:capsular polysaccharide biosynthesis protein